jgi:hypothetical protein
MFKAVTVGLFLLALAQSLAMAGWPMLAQAGLQLDEQEGLEIHGTVMVSGSRVPVPGAEVELRLRGRVMFARG